MDKTKISLAFLFLLVLLPSITAFSVNIPIKPVLNDEGNYSINVSYADQAGNSHLFNDYSVSGLYSYYKGLLETYFDGLYCQLTGCTMAGDIDMGDNDITNVNNITANKYDLGQNNSYGMWSNSTDMIIGNIGGL